MDSSSFDRLTRLFVSSRSRRVLGGAVLGSLAGLLGLGETEAAPCPKGKKRCRTTCISKKRCCTTAQCRPKATGRVCRRGRCVCPASKKRCGRRCIPKAVCCRDADCGTGQICRAGSCCYGTAAALHAALEPGGPATIQLCPHTTYRGTFFIARNVTVLGAGVNSTVLDGGGNDNVVSVRASVTAAILGRVRITNARTVTGFDVGVFNAGTLTLIESTVIDNQAAAGGLYNMNGATLTLSRCTVTNNEGNTGGGISNEGTLTVIESVLSGNRALSSGGGIYNWSGTVTLIDSVVAGNMAEIDGGGILNAAQADAKLLLRGASRVTNNEAGNDGGGIHNTAPGSVEFFDASCVSDDNRPSECNASTVCFICPP
jgi:hypothetical protein